MTQFRPKDKVKVTRKGYNASQFNKGLHPLGVYSIPNWENTTFTIEGTVKLCSFEHSKDIYGAYLLSYKDNPIGYVYSDALETSEGGREITEEEIKTLTEILSKVKDLTVATSMVRGGEGKNYNCVRICSEGKEIFNIKTTKVW